MTDLQNSAKRVSTLASLFRKVLFLLVFLAILSGSRRGTEVAATFAHAPTDAPLRLSGAVRSDRRGSGATTSAAQAQQLIDGEHHRAEHQMRHDSGGPAHIDEASGEIALQPRVELLHDGA